MWPKASMFFGSVATPKEEAGGGTRGEFSEMKTVLMFVIFNAALNGKNRDI